MWKVVIQDKQTLKFLTEAEDWTHDVASARSFGRIHDAAQYCARHEFRCVHLVMGIPKEDGSFAATSKTILQVPRVHARSGKANGNPSVP